MTRKEFLRKSAILGAVSPFMASFLSSCTREDDPLTEGWNVNFSGKVIVIGAGAAGMTAGHILNRFGIDFEILEAASIHGGRVKKLEGFAEVPLDLGAEWIHTDPAILARLRNDTSRRDPIEIVTYEPETLRYWDGSSLRRINVASNFYGEWKFRRSTWWDFFDQYFVANFRNRIIYDAPVISIDYSGPRVRVTTADNMVREADKVLLTASVGVLQNDMIAFTPAWPSDKIAALDSIDFPAGFKASIEFSERFYPDLMSMSREGLLSEDNPELFIDGVFRKGIDQHIMHLFTVQDPAAAYSALATDQEKLDYLLGRLDMVFAGKASASYLRHVFQDWTNEPYVRGSYSFPPEDAQSTINALRAPLDDKLYFAGEACADNYSTVHGAAESAYRAMELILQS